MKFVELNAENQQVKSDRWDKQLPGTSENIASGIGNRPVEHEWLRSCGVVPVNDCACCDGQVKPRNTSRCLSMALRRAYNYDSRHIEVDGVVVTGFKNKDADVRVFRQTRSNDETSGSS